MARITKGNFQVPNQNIKQYAPDITDKDYKHSVVSSKLTPMGFLLTMVEGTSLTVDYYSQVLGRDEEPSTFDPYKDGAHQQYVYTKNLEIKLQSELSQSFDPEDQTANITGTAVMYPYHRPNVGDVFIADIGDGQAGLFSITDVERKSMFKQACYEINFVLADYLTPDLESKLKQKTVKETEFVKDFMVYGQNPIIATTDKVKYDNLSDLRDDVLSDWLSEFYSVEFRTILVPNKNTPTYDPFILEMLSKIFNRTDHVLLTDLQRLNVDERNLNYSNDIWDVLIQREAFMLRSAFSKIQVISSKAMLSNPFLHGAYWSGIKALIMPVSNGFYMDDNLGVNCVFRSNESLTLQQVSDANNDLPDISDKSYVFSHRFYQDTNAKGLSKLEYLVNNYLNFKANDDKEIVRLVNLRHEWSKLERFYFTPVLLILLINEIRSI